MLQQSVSDCTLLEVCTYVSEGGRGTSTFLGCVCDGVSRVSMHPRLGCLVSILGCCGKVFGLPLLRPLQLWVQISPLAWESLGYELPRMAGW